MKITDYQQKVVDMTHDEIDMELADIASRLRDISDSLDRNITIMTTVDKAPVILVDGEVSNSLSFDEDPIFGGIFDESISALKNLSIFKSWT